MAPISVLIHHNHCALFLMWPVGRNAKFVDGIGKFSRSFDVPGMANNPQGQGPKDLIHILVAVP